MSGILANCSSNAIVSGGMGTVVGQSGKGRQLGASVLHM